MDGSESILLPTPGIQFLASLGSEAPDEDAALQASREFSFPFPKAYDIQIHLMINIFRAIEDGKVGVFESPTGTGKSLSLICSAFTWLRQNSDRAAKGEMQQLAQRQGDEPDWVIKHQQDKRRKELKASDDQLKERIRTIRAKQSQFRRRSKLASSNDGHQDGYSSKRLKRDFDVEPESDDDFLASDIEANDDLGSGSRSAKRRLGMTSYSKKDIQDDQDEYSNLSPEVRTLMAQFQAEKKSSLGALDNDEEPETLPRIIYANRTHSQLAQFVAELRKTDFGKRVKLVNHWTADYPTAPPADQPDKSDPIRTISLGSRRQMCINSQVQTLGRKAGTEAMNERCLELLKGKASSSSKGTKKKCEFLPPQDEAGRAQVLDFRDHAMAEVSDIEDLVQLGKELKTCPYFAAKTSARQAELITLPYNLLLQKEARASLGISFKDCVILIDEAHNLIDNILSTHTVTITADQIDQASRQIQIYLERFALKLKGSNEEHLRQVHSVLEGLKRYCGRWKQSKQGLADGAKGYSSAATVKVVAEEVVTASHFVAEMGGNLDQINLVRLEMWLKETQIARKVSGYADKQAMRQQSGLLQPPKKGPGKASNRASGHNALQAAVTNSDATAKTAPSAIGAMHAIESFILSLANRTEDGRILLSLTQAPDQDNDVRLQGLPKAGSGGGGNQVVTLKYQLLNPSHVFESLVEEARAVILAGGTMEPISDFRQQLVPSLPADRFTTFSCDHIIPPSNLSATVLGSGPRGVPFEFKYESRNDPIILDELGSTIVNLCNLIPDGLVVFVPSYAFLDGVMKRWSDAKSGVLQRISAKKKVFLEPKTTMEVDQVLRDYTLEIDAPKTGRSGGSILFAVVGAKLSEGINFSDQLARGVVMVGMPFANVKSPDLAERMRYVRELAKKSGQAAPSDAGNELYTNLCMKAVNQSIGRAIRHEKDYAALILLDKRYGRADIRARLPGWIRKEIKVAHPFGVAAQAIAAFFRNKKQQQPRCP